MKIVLPALVCKMVMLIVVIVVLMKPVSLDVNSAMIVIYILVQALSRAH